MHSGENDAYLEHKVVNDFNDEMKQINLNDYNYMSSYELRSFESFKNHDIFET